MILQFLENFVWGLGSKPAVMALSLGKPKWTYLPPIFVAAHNVAMPPSPPIIKLWRHDYNLRVLCCPVTIPGVCMAIVVITVKSFVELERLFLGIAAWIFGFGDESMLFCWTNLGGESRMRNPWGFFCHDEAESLSR